VEVTVTNGTGTPVWVDMHFGDDALAWRGELAPDAFFRLAGWVPEGATLEGHARPTAALRGEPFREELPPCPRWTGAVVLVQGPDGPVPTVTGACHGA